MYIYEYTYMCIHIHPTLHIDACTCIHISVYPCTCIYICMYMYVYTYIHMYIDLHDSQIHIIPYGCV